MQDPHVLQLLSDVETTLEDTRLHVLQEQSLRLQAEKQLQDHQ